MCSNALTTIRTCAIHSGIFVVSSAPFLFQPDSLPLYGFQLPAALFTLVRIFFHAFFFALRNTERVGGAVLRSVPHSLTHSLSSILSLPSRQYRDCSFLATLILRETNFYLESDSTEEQPFLHDSQGIKKKKEERKGQQILHGYIFPPTLIVLRTT